MPIDDRRKSRLPIDGVVADSRRELVRRVAAADRDETRDVDGALEPECRRGATTYSLFAAGAFGSRLDPTSGGGRDSQRHARERGMPI